ncbi:MAG: SH3 domain-containing protein [Caldilineaceae bacterium]
MRKRQLAAWSVLCAAALTLLGGCTQLDTPEEVRRALMSIVLPPPDATAEPSPAQAIAVTSTSEISATTAISETDVIDTAAPTVVISPTTPLSQTTESAEVKVLTVGEVRARRPQPNKSPAEQAITTTAELSATSNISNTAMATATLPVSATVAANVTAPVDTADDIAESQPMVSIATDGSRLNVRSEPVADAPIVGKLSPDAVIEVLDSSADDQWLQVAFDEEGTQGWIAAQYTQPVEPVRTVNAQPTSAASQKSGDHPVAPIVLAPRGDLNYHNVCGDHCRIAHYE